MNAAHSLFDHCADEIAAVLARSQNDSTAIAAVLARYERTYPFRFPVALVAACLLGISSVSPSPPRGTELRAVLDTLFHGSRQGDSR